MRFSANRDSPFYSDRAVRDGQVSIDGVPLQLVVECDTDEGWADVLATTDHGKLKTAADGDSAELIRYTGNVEVTFKERE